MHLIGSNKISCGSRSSASYTLCNAMFSRHGIEFQIHRVLIVSNQAIGFALAAFLLSLVDFLQTTIALNSKFNAQVDRHALKLKTACEASVIDSSSAPSSRIPKPARSVLAD